MSAVWITILSLVVLCMTVDCGYRYRYRYTPPKQPNNVQYGNNYYQNTPPPPTPPPQQLSQQQLQQQLPAQIRQQVRVNDQFFNVYTQLSPSIWYIKYELLQHASSCDVYRKFILFGTYRTATLTQYCSFLKDACSKTTTAVQSSDCYVQYTAIALQITCCRDTPVPEQTTPRVFTQPPQTTQPTTRLTTQPTTRATTQPTTRATTQRVITPGIRTCGKSTFPNSRIVGGTNTTECELPWTVGILRGGVFSCGGTIINDRTIITAAHCASQQTTYAVEVGKWRTNSLADRFNEIIPVMNVKIHESFDSVRLLNDIAVLTLARPISFGICAQPACVPESRDIPQTAKCTVAGWGTIRFRGPQPTLLQKVDLTVYLPNVCRVQFSEPVTVVTDGILCADNDNEGGKDGCQGDSGGPLVCLVNGFYTLFGVVSSGRGCAVAGQAGFYTFIPFFRDWIDAQLALAGQSL